MKNEEKERLIWEYLDTHMDSKIAQDMRFSDQDSIKHSSHFIEFKMLDEDLKNMPLKKIDRDFSVQMKESILQSLSKPKNQNKFDIGLFSITIGLLILSIYYLFTTQIENELKVSEWVSTWEMSLPSPEKINIPLDFSYDFNWSMYLILVIPFVLLSLDWLSENYLKFQSKLIKRSFLLV